jgi:hypothetical protein
MALLLNHTKACPKGIKPAGAGFFFACINLGEPALRKSAQSHRSFCKKIAGEAFIHRS